MVMRRSYLKGHKDLFCLPDVVQYSSGHTTRLWTYVIGLKEFLGNAYTNCFERELPLVQEKGTETLTGKTCIITGANTGIGFATAGNLLRRGCHVILACRSKEKALRAAQALQLAGPDGRRPSGSVEVAELDLSNLLSIKHFIESFNKQKRPLHLIILNAGIMAPEHRSVTKDGFEAQFQVNYLSQWALARGLVAEQLKRQSGQDGTPNSLRVVFLSSTTHVGGSLDFTDLQLEREGHYTGFRGYVNSKLATVLAAKQLQTYFDRRRGGALACSATAVHPGMVNTELAVGWLTGSDVFYGILQSLTAPLLKKLTPVILISSERAAETVVYAALAPAAQVAGQYIANSKVTKCSRRARDPVLAQRLWDVSLELTGSTPGEIEAS